MKDSRCGAGRLPRPALRAWATEAGNDCFSSGSLRFLNNNHFEIFLPGGILLESQNIMNSNGFQAFPGRNRGLIFLPLVRNGPSNVSVFHVIYVASLRERRAPYRRGGGRQRLRAAAVGHRPAVADRRVVIWEPRVAIGGPCVVIWVRHVTLLSTLITDKTLSILSRYGILTDDGIAF